MTVRKQSGPRPRFGRVMARRKRSAEERQMRELGIAIRKKASARTPGPGPQLSTFGSGICGLVYTDGETSTHPELYV